MSSGTLATTYIQQADSEVRSGAQLQLCRLHSLFLSIQPLFRLAYEPPASSTFLSQQTSHQQSVSSIFLSEQISISHQPPAKRTGCQWFAVNVANIKIFQE
jgi:hypothetical protein